jgi:hypothetical protein
MEESPEFANPGASLHKWKYKSLHIEEFLWQIERREQ